MNKTELIEKAQKSIIKLDNLKHEIDKIRSSFEELIFYLEGIDKPKSVYLNIHCISIGQEAEIIKNHMCYRVFSRSLFDLSHKVKMRDIWFNFWRKEPVDILLCFVSENTSCSIPCDMKLYEHVPVILFVIGKDSSKIALPEILVKMIVYLGECNFEENNPIKVILSSICTVCLNTSSEFYLEEKEE